MARTSPADINQYLNIGDVAAIDITGTVLSVTAWVYANSLTSADQDVVSKSQYSVPQVQYHLGLTTGNVVIFQIGDGATNDNAIGTTALSTGQWYHLGGVKNGTGAGAMKVYLNGAQDASITSNLSIQNTANSLRVWRRDTASDHTWNGRIAEVAIWNIALTADEFAALAKGVSPNMVHPTGLKGYWPIWASGSPEPDLSGNANNATVNGTLALANHAPVGLYAPTLGPSFQSSAAGSVAGLASDTPIGIAGRGAGW